MNRSCRKPTGGFTRLELLACLAALALVTNVMVCAVAMSASRQDRIACSNNLRQIGNALQQFGREHNDQLAWRLPPSEGGNNAAFAIPAFSEADDPTFAIPAFSEADDPNKSELWYQYWWIRDLLKTPTVLMDPGETRANARPATNWERDPNGGFQTFKNNAVAYVLGADSSTAIPETILAADRHMINNETPRGGCSSQINQAAQLSPATVTWHNEVHGSVGNVAFADGGVRGLDTNELRRAIGAVRDFFPSVHMIGAQF
jgi:prepilin-type processing-associated H-X9-DG protein